MSNVKKKVGLNFYLYQIDFQLPQKSLVHIEISGI